MWLAVGVVLNIVNPNLNGWVGMGDVFYFGLPAGICAFVGACLAVAMRVKREPRSGKVMLFAFAAVAASILMAVWGQTLVNRGHDIHWDDKR